MINARFRAAVAIVGFIATAVLVVGCKPLLGPTNQVAEPVFTPGGGTYSSDVAVAIGTATSGAAIHYTTDGSTPSNASASYSGPIQIAGNGTTTTIKAIAMEDGLDDSTIAESIYKISYTQVAAPQFSPVGGTYSADQNVVLTSATAGVSIRYTTDGSTPSGASSLYSGPIPVTGNGTTMTIKAIATKSGMTNSLLGVATYTINYNQVSTPQLSPGTSTVGLGTTITFSDATSGATFYYTTDGSQPTSSSASGTSYTISGPVTLKVVAMKSGMAASTVATATYSVQLAAPTFSPAPGGVLIGTTVTFSSSTTGVTFYYTLDGSTPTTGSSTGPGYTVNGGVTLKVIAVKAGWITSAVASGVYYIQPASMPTFSSSVTATGGYLTSNADITIATSTAGATIYYTTDGSTPTTASPIYSSPVHISGNGIVTRIQAMAAKSGMSNSGVSAQNFAISYPIYTVAGNGTSGSSGDGGPATSAQLNAPTRIAVDPSGNLYIVDTTGNQVRKVTPGGTISVFAGTGTAGYTGDGGAATAATLNAPDDVDVDAAGNVYIADSGNYEIRMVDTSGKISTFGRSTLGGGPNAIAVSPNGEPIYVAQYWAHSVYPIVNGVATSNIAGTSGTCGYSGDGGVATSALLCYPNDVDLDAAGNLYIYDGGNYRIRKVSTNGIITTIAGTGSYSANFGDGGPATSAEISMNGHLTLDSVGNIYLADGTAHVRKIDLAGIIRRIVGGGSTLGDGGPALGAKMINPQGVAIGPSGNLYIADSSDSRVRKAMQ